MAHYERGYCARHAKTRPAMWRTPARHNIEVHTRPRRRATWKVCFKVIRGYDPETLMWPIEKRPKDEYW